MVFMEADALRLVLCPPVGSLSFEAQSFGMCPVTEQRHTGNKYRHDRDRNGDRQDQRMVLVPVMALRKFDALTHSYTLFSRIRPLNQKKSFAATRAPPPACGRYPGMCAPPRQTRLQTVMAPKICPDQASRERTERIAWCRSAWRLNNFSRVPA